MFVEGPQKKHCFCVTCVRSLAIPAHSLQIVLGDAPAAVPIHMSPRLAMAAGYPECAARAGRFRLGLRARLKWLRKAATASPMLRPLAGLQW